ncbi:HPP family protein [Lysinibacillus pakistanensis]|uniref:HPP family protein n=1 Tax=Lysinibacillus pakistanensis TaxID=759811 RepID=UPI003D315F22
MENSFCSFKKACKGLHFWTYISKMRGSNYTSSKFTFIDSFISCIGRMLCIFILLLLTNYMNIPWLMASFGANIVLVFGVWYTPFSQPSHGLVFFHYVAQIHMG